MDDARALADLLHRIEKWDGLPYRTSIEEVVELFDSSDRFASVGGFIDGRLRAYGYIRVFDEEPVVASCQGGVDPEYRSLGLGGALVAWHTQNASAALEQCPHESKQIAFNVEEGHRDLEQHLLGYGYEWRRSYYDLRASLEVEPKEVALDSFTTIVEWDSIDDADVTRAINRITLDQEGRAGTTRWISEDRAGFTPEWSFIALDHHADRPEIAGLIMASKYSQDWSVLGWREGSIDMLAVLPGYHDTNIASALVTASMKAQRDAGMEAVVAGMSSAASSSVMSVYDELGFSTVATSRMYTLQLD